LRYLVTGGAGAIGSVLVKRLLDKNAKVTVFDDFSSGHFSFLEDVKNAIRLIKGNILDRAAVESSVKGQDYVYHLAANPGVAAALKTTDLDLRIGVLGTYNVLEAMRVSGVRNIGFSSSSTVYGEAEVIPTPEDYGTLRPISLYGASKLACEAFISAFVHCFGFRAWIYRFANVVGGTMTHGALWDFLWKLKRDPSMLEILGDGNQSKSYLWVEDCVDAMLLCEGQAGSDFNVFNIGTEGWTAARRVAEILIEELGLSNVELRFTGGNRGWTGDVPRMMLHIGRVKRLGWSPRYGSDEAVRIAARHLKKRYWK